MKDYDPTEDLAIEVDDSEKCVICGAALTRLEEPYGMCEDCMYDGASGANVIGE